MLANLSLMMKITGDDGKCMVSNILPALTKPGSKRDLCWGESDKMNKDNYCNSAAGQTRALGWICAERRKSCRNTPGIRLFCMLKDILFVILLSRIPCKARG